MLAPAWISDIRAGTTPTYGNHIKSSCSLIAFNSDRPGVLGIISQEGHGESKRHVAYLGCHSDLVTDLDFSPFDDFLLASGSADRTIKLWRLTGAKDTLPSVPGIVLGPEELPVEVVQFHPTSDGVLVSTAGRAVKIWDAAKQQPLTELEAHKDLVQSAVWSRNGALVGTTCKDKQLQIFDPRARTKASQSTQAHENSRDTRLAWTGIQEHLVSTGFNQMREREVKLWDTRHFSSALASITFETSSGPHHHHPSRPDLLCSKNIYSAVAVLQQWPTSPQAHKGPFDGAAERGRPHHACCPNRTQAYRKSTWAAAATTAASVERGPTQAQCYHLLPHMTRHPPPPSARALSSR
ncbi:hypothetical protein NN561_018451 [Cricetulus griseus]